MPETLRWFTHPSPTGLSKTDSRTREDEALNFLLILKAGINTLTTASTPSLLWENQTAVIGKCWGIIRDGTWLSCWDWQLALTWAEPGTQKGKNTLEREVLRFLHILQLEENSSGSVSSTASQCFLPLCGCVCDHMCTYPQSENTDRKRSVQNSWLWVSQLTTK